MRSTVLFLEMWRHTYDNVSNPSYYVIGDELSLNKILSKVLHFIFIYFYKVRDTYKFFCAFTVKIMRVELFFILKVKSDMN